MVCGIVALVNIFARDLTRSQDDAVLAIGVVFWALGGVLCWASDAIQVKVPPASAPHEEITSVRITVAYSTPDLLNRQWQEYAVRDVVSRVGLHHL